MSAWRHYNVFIAQTESTDRGDKRDDQMATCCPTFRAELLAARHQFRRVQLDAFQGYAEPGEVEAARERLTALEGNPDPLRTLPIARQYKLARRLDARRRAARIASR